MTREEALLNAYLKGLKTGQSKIVSAGTQAVSSAADEGVKMLEQAANVHIPSMYDYSEDMYKLIQEQQEQQIRAQNAAQRAAAAAAEKQQQEQQKKQKETFRKQQAEIAQTKAKQAYKDFVARTSQNTPQTAQNTSFQSVSSGKRKENNDIINRIISEHPEQSPPSPQQYGDIAQGEYSNAFYEYASLAKKFQDLESQKEQLLAQIEEVQKNATGFDLTNPDSEQFKAIREIGKQIEQIEAQKSEMNQDMSEKDKNLKKAVSGLSEENRLRIYNENWYILSDEELEDAKRIINKYRSDDFYRDFRNKDSKEKEIYRITEELETKTSPGAAFLYSGNSAIPGYDWLLETIDAESFSNMDAVKAQHPEAAVAGTVTGSVLVYAAVKGGIKAIPELNTGAAKASQALATTSWAQAARELPVLGRAFTSQGLTNIVSDMVVDTALDTVPGIVQGVQEEKPISAVVMDAAGNFIANAGMNIAAEGVFGTVGDALKNRQNGRIPMLEAPDTIQPDIPVPQLKQEIQANTDNIAGPVMPQIKPGVQAGDLPAPSRLAASPLRVSDTQLAELLHESGQPSLSAFNAKYGTHISQTDPAALSVDAVDFAAYGYNGRPAENLLHLLEDTAGAAQPSSGIGLGQSTLQDLRDINAGSYQMREGGFAVPQGEAEQAVHRLKQAKAADAIAQIAGVIERLQKSGTNNSGDAAVALDQLQRVDQLLSQMDRTTDEYRSVFYLSQRAKELTFRDSAHKAEQLLEPAEKTLIDAQLQIHRMVQTLKKRKPGPFSDAVFKARQGVKQAWKQAAEAAEKAVYTEIAKWQQAGQAAVQPTAAGLGLDFRGLAQQSAKTRADAWANMRTNLRRAVGISDVQAEQVLQRGKQAYDDALKTAVGQNLRSMLPEIFAGEQNDIVRQAYDKFISLLDAGIYSDDMLEELAASGWGVAPLSPEQTDQIRSLLRQASGFPEKSRARADLQVQAAEIAAGNINSSLLEKWETWCSTASLNDHTSVENHNIGKVSQALLARTKEVVQAGAEAGVDWFAKTVRKTNGIQRTTAIVTPFTDRALMAQAFKDADTFAYADLVGGGEAFDIGREMMKNRTVFRSQRPGMGRNAAKKGLADKLESIRSRTARAMETANYEGSWGILYAFADQNGNRLQQAAADKLRRTVQRGEEGWYGISGLRNNYAWSLAQYLKANGADETIFTKTDHAGAELLKKARDWALKQALINTYSEEEKISSAFAGLMETLSQDSGTGGKIAASVLQSFVPMTKKSVNALKSTYRYSPLGMLSAIAKAIDPAHTGKYAAADVIDSASKSAVGTMLFILGGVLAKNGMLQAELSEEESEAAQITGQQEYALNLTGPDGRRYSYTLDWISPISLPMLMGAQLVKYKQQIGEHDTAIDALIGAADAMTDPVRKMSLLKSVDDAIRTAVNSRENAGLGDTAAAVLMPIVSSYVSQGIPAFMRQLAHGIDPLQRSSDTEQTGVLGIGLQEMKKLQNDIVGLSFMNQPDIDPLGRERRNPGGNILGRLAYQLLSPGNLSQTQDTGLSAYPKSPEIQGRKSQNWIESLYDYPLTGVLGQEQLLKQYESGYSMVQDAAERMPVSEIRQRYQNEINSGNLDLDSGLQWIYDNFGEDMVIELLTVQKLIEGVDTTRSGNKAVKTKKESAIELLMQYGYTRQQAEKLYSLLTESDGLF